MSRAWKQTSGFLYSHTTKWIELHIYMLFLTMKSYLLIISYTPHPVTTPISRLAIAHQGPGDDGTDPGCMLQRLTPCACAVLHPMSSGRGCLLRAISI